LQSSNVAPTKSQVAARGTDGIDQLVAPWRSEEEEEEEEEDGYETWITEHGSIQGTLYGPERLAFVGFFYIAHRYTSRQVSPSSPKPRHGTRIFTALRDTLFSEYCVILRTSVKGKDFWGEKLNFGTNLSTDHQFLQWNERHSELVLEENIGNLRLKREPKWLDWVQGSNSCLRPRPPKFGTEQQADFGVDEKEELNDNKDDIDPEEGQRRPAQRKTRMWWKTLIAGDVLTPTQFAKYQDVQRMFLDEFCVQGHAPAPERVDSQVSCAHCTQAQSLTKFNNGPTHSCVCWTVLGKTRRTCTFEFRNIFCTPVRTSSSPSRRDPSQQCSTVASGTRLSVAKQH
jgi:hypothetical protein